MNDPMKTASPTWGMSPTGQSPQHQQQPGVSPGFSTLEVAPGEYDPEVKTAPQVYWDTSPEALPYQQQTVHDQNVLMQQYYQNYPHQHGYGPPGSVSSPPPMTGYSTVHSQSMGPSSPSQGAVAGSPRAAGDGGAGGEKKILGMTRKTALIVGIVIAIAVIGAAVGGAVGGVLSRNSSGSATGGSGGNGTNSGNQTAGAGSTFLASTSLNTAIYTTGSITYKMMLWQPSGGETDIKYSLWNSTGRAWETVKLSSRLSGSGSNNIEARPGTPLTTAVKTNGTFSLSVFYLSASNVIQELRTDTPGGLSWTKITSSVSVAAGSQLSARWDYCDLCSGALLVAYEDEGHRQRWYYPVEATNTTRTTTLSAKVVPGAGLALTGLSADDGATDDYGSSIKLYIQNVTRVQEITRRSNYDWVITKTDINENLPTDFPPLTYTTSFSKPVLSDQPLIFLFVVNLFRNGTLQATHYNGKSWRAAIAPIMRSVPSTMTSTLTNFTALTVATDLTVYGLTGDGVLHSFAPDLDDPVTWTYGGQVTLPS